jgi:hypothetical protein
VLVKGDDDDDDDGWSGSGGLLLNDGSETEHQELARAENAIELNELENEDGTNGSAELSWKDVFEDPRPVDVDDHDAIDVEADFSVHEDGETRMRELTVDIEVYVEGEDGDYGPGDDPNGNDGEYLGDRRSATATITVNNEEAEIEIGGQGSFEIDGGDQDVGSSDD